MSCDYQIQALAREPFEPFLRMSSAELAALGIRSYIADSVPGYPCRVSLIDAPLGDELLLVNYEHLPVETPYRSAGPIFVRRHATAAVLPANHVPEMLLGRPLSVRGYDREGMMVDAEVTPGSELEPLIARLFDSEEIEFLHVHFARRGCYACRVDRI